MGKITKRTVDASHPRDRRYYVWDTEIKGFGLLVLPTGVKSYFYQYRTPLGRGRRITIGKHGGVTPDEARSKADDLRSAVKQGRDPLGEKEGQRNAPTVGELLDAYLDSEKFKDKAASTKAIDRGRIERHLRPLIGRRHIETLTPEDIQRALAAIKDGKTAADVKTKSRGRARVKGGAGTAKMAIDLLRAIFSWGIGERWLKENPCHGISTGTTGTRDTILESTGDYTRLFKTLEKLEGEKAIRPQVADAIRIIALTGARRSEIAGLRWQYVDLQTGRIELPPAAHKTGKRTQKPRIIGLPTAAQAIIARQPAGEPDSFVFAPARGAGAISLSKPWRKIRTKAELPEGIGLHGLRHSLASHLAMGGAEAAAIMNALGHRQLSTAQRYVHWAKDARQALAETAAAVPLAGLARAQGKKRAKVKEIRRGLRK